MARVVDVVVGAYRRRGMKAEHAREAAARHLRVSPRRVRAYLGGEVQSVPAHEAIAIMEGFARARAALETQIAAEREQLARLETRCEAVSSMLSGGEGLPS